MSSKIASFLDDLFGTIASPSIPGTLANIDFIPADDNGHTIKLKGNRVKWMGLRNRIQQKKAYEFCFTVATVIDRLAEYDLTGKFDIFREEGKGAGKPIKNDWAKKIRKLMKQPSPLQGWYQYRGQQVVYKRNFGFCLILPILPAGFTDPADATALINLPPWCCEPVGTRVFIAGKIESIIKEWRVTILGKVITLRPDQVFMLQDGFHMDETRDFMVPMSRLVGLDMAVSNICAAMEADNVLLRKRGPLGFISHDAAAAKDSQVGYIPMSKSQKRDLQRDLQNYGLSLEQYQYVISRAPAKWVPMGSNLGDLRTIETVTQGEKIICRRYGFPHILFEETEATYANGDNAAATVYQTNVMPSADRDMAEYNKFFKAEENNANFVIDFGHVAALQEDKSYEADALEKNVNTYKILYEGNFLTKNQMLEKLGLEQLPPEDGDIYFRDEQAEANSLTIDMEAEDATVVEDDQIDDQNKAKKPKQLK